MSKHDDQFSAIAFCLGVMKDMLKDLKQVLSNDEVITMNQNDIRVMLSFLDIETAYVEETIVLQCYHARDIPYLKRALSHALGQPDAMHDNRWRYGKKTFSMMPYYRDMEGFHGKVFYVSYEDESDWKDIMRKAYHCNDATDVCPYMITSTFNLADVYTMLVQDGMSGGQALNTIANVEIMSV